MMRGMAKVEVTLIPWAGDHEADTDDETASMFVYSVKVNGVVYGGQIDREDQFENRAKVKFESGDFAIVEINGPEAKTLRETMDPSEYLIYSQGTTLFLPVSEIKVGTPVKA